METTAKKWYEKELTLVLMDIAVPMITVIFVVKNSIFSKHRKAAWIVGLVASSALHFYIAYLMGFFG